MKSKKTALFLFVFLVSFFCTLPSYSNPDAFSEWKFHPANPQNAFFPSQDPAFKGTLAYEGSSEVNLPTLLVYEIEREKKEPHSPENKWLNQRFFKGEAIDIHRKGSLVVFQVRQKDQELVMPFFYIKKKNHYLVLCFYSQRDQFRLDLKKLGPLLRKISQPKAI